MAPAHIRGPELRGMEGSGDVGFEEESKRGACVYHGGYPPWCVCVCIDMREEGRHRKNTNKNMCMYELTVYVIIGPCMYLHTLYVCTSVRLSVCMSVRMYICPISVCLPVRRNSNVLV